MGCAGRSSAQGFATARPVSVVLRFVVTYGGDVWTALGDPTRKAIFELLLERPRAVVDLAGELPVSRPAVSQHLRVLKDVGLVIDQPNGSRRVYRVDPDGLVKLRADLERYWGKALAAYKLAVEQPTKEDR
jgi:DNA-binding transcriptional ArsR family regulator